MKIRDTSTVYAYAITLCMGSFVFGYELSSFSNLSPTIAHYLNQHHPTYINNLMTYFNLLFGISNLIGIIFYNYFKQFGWMLTFKVTDILTIVAAVIGIIDLSITTQTWSRILFGIVTGINTILIPTFLTSILPGSMGAPAGTLNQFFIVFGIFIGFLAGHLILNNAESAIMWRIIVVIPIIAALIRQKILADSFPYESLEDYMQNGNQQLLQHYLDKIYENTTIQQFKENKRLTDLDIHQETSPLCQHNNHFYRLRLSVALVIAGLNQLSGGAALSYFLNNQPQSYKPQERLNIFIFLNLLQTIVTLFSGQFLQRYGRRVFMQEGQKIIILALFLIGIVQIMAPEYGNLSILLIFIHMVGFSLSYGPCTFLIGTEVVNDIFYPALLQWALITFNIAVIEPLVQILGIGPLCLIYGILQIFAYFFLQTYQVQTQGKLRRVVYHQYRSLKCQRNLQKKSSIHQELILKDKNPINDGYFSFQQSNQPI